MAEQAPQRTVDNPDFKQMVESAQKLLGIPNPEIELTQENEEFWNNPEFIAAFDEIDNAIARREQYRAKIAEGPSFSLGMTPDEVERVINRVQRTAKKSAAKSPKQKVMSDEFTAPTGPSTDTTPNLTQQTTTEELTTPAEQQEKVDEMLPPEPQEKESQQIEQDDEEENPIQMHTEKSLGKQQTTTEELTALAEQQDDVDEDDEEQDPIQMQTEKSLGKEPQQPETRTKKRQVKPTNPLKSPYLTRQVDMKRPWTATEKIIGKWVLQNDNVDPPVWGKVTVNDHSATTLYTVVAPYGDNALRTKRFTERMDNEIRQTEGLNLQDIELFVFPIVHSHHYFVLTVNVKNKRFDILDNSSSDSPGNESMEMYQQH
nr:200 kDa antigen P200 [Ipomoea batatas]